MLARLLVVLGVCSGLVCGWDLEEFQDRILGTWAFVSFQDAYPHPQVDALAHQVASQTDEIKVIQIPPTFINTFRQAYAIDEPSGVVLLHPNPQTEHQQVKHYRGPLLQPKMLSFLHHATGVKNVKLADKRKRSACLPSLSQRNFESVALNPTKSVALIFCADWHSKCKQHQSVWQQLGEAFCGETSVDVYFVNVSENGELAMKHQVAIPAVVVYPIGQEKTPVQYNLADFKIEDLVQFINGLAGTNRLADGSVDSAVGQVAELSQLVAGFGDQDTAMQSANVDKARRVLDECTQPTCHEYTSYYIKTMLKVMQGSRDHVKDEMARLQRVVQSPGTHPKQKSSFYHRINILKQFLSRSARACEDDVCGAL